VADAFRRFPVPQTESWLLLMKAQRPVARRGGYQDQPLSLARELAIPAAQAASMRTATSVKAV
jgi:hypothetical protein